MWCFPAFFICHFSCAVSAQLLVVTWTGQQQHKGSWQAQQSREGETLSSGVSQPCVLFPSPSAQCPQQPHGARQVPLATRAKHIQGQLWTWSLTQKLSAQILLCKEEMRGFSSWLHSLLWADREWQNLIVLLGKSPFSFSACLQLPHLMMLCAAGGIQAPIPWGQPKLQTSLGPWLGAQGGHHIQITPHSQGEHGSPPSPCGSWAAVCNVQLSSLAFVK